MNVASAIAFNRAQAVNLAALRALGWWPWAQDVTTAAGVAEVAVWQAARGLVGDGMIGAGTWAALRATFRPQWGKTARGEAEIVARYGDPRPPTNRAIWARDNLVQVHALGRTIGNVHRLVAAEFVELVETAARISGYTPATVQTWNVRRKRGGDNDGTTWSVHSWALAFDFDPTANPWGNLPSSPIVAHPLFAAVFRVAGWSCGCDWKTPDTMHLQAVRGY